MVMSEINPVSDSSAGVVVGEQPREYALDAPLSSLSDVDCAGQVHWVTDWSLESKRAWLLNVWAKRGLAILTIGDTRILPGDVLESITIDKHTRIPLPRSPWHKRFKIRKLLEKTFLDMTHLIRVNGIPMREVFEKDDTLEAFTLIIPGYDTQNGQFIKDLTISWETPSNATIADVYLELLGFNIHEQTELTFNTHSLTNVESAHNALGAIINPTTNTITWEPMRLPLTEWTATLRNKQKTQVTFLTEF